MYGGVDNAHTAFTQALGDAVPQYLAVTEHIYLRLRRHDPQRIIGHLLGNLYRAERATPRLFCKVGPRMGSEVGGRKAGGGVGSRAYWRRQIDRRELALQAPPS